MRCGKIFKTYENGQKVVYGYDQYGRNNEIRVTQNGTVLSSTKYEFDTMSRLTRVVGHDGTAVVYSYDANGNLLNQSGAGKASIYTYDLYNRLIQYVEGSKKESYSYDAEVVRRSKVNSEKTIYYVSDTTGSLSYTLAETDKAGNVIATYNRADVLISQVREEETSYYLFDGHGDVRALFDTDGAVTDTYRYNAYGELLERSGDTENHYLYTGEYYDGTSNLYYLRARYMNPSTGTFISMDTYEGSIYDPDTLHKYLYANGNPVKYSDPSGHMFGAFGSFVSFTVQTAINNAAKLNVLGVISGVTSSVITSFLGGSTDDAIMAFVNGYIAGFGMGAILCVAAVYGVIVYAQMLLMTTAASVAMTVTMMVYSVIENKEKETLVYGTLAILSLITLYQAYGFYGVITVMGSKGSAKIGWGYDNPEEVQIENGRGTKVFTSKDPLVGDVATQIEQSLPGRVKSVNKVVYRSDGSILTDLDIELDSIVIQVKAGGGKGLTKQLINSANSTGKTAIAYAPDVKPSVLKEATNSGFKVFTNIEDLIEFISQN